LDIADDRREELIAYVTEKFGHDKVAQICTFGRMLARAAVRDVARVMSQPYAIGDRIAKVIPLGSQGFPMTIDKALDTTPDFKVMYSTDAITKQVVDLGRQIEGNARHASVHAAGIVVSPTAMTNFSPLQLEPNGSNQSFSVALVNEQGNGVILSTLHVRDRVNTFAKPITNYESEYDLTEEELAVLDDAREAHKSSV
jgi:DNA polymerase-3 subunit alpha